MIVSVSFKNDGQTNRINHRIGELNSGPLSTRKENWGECPTCGEAAEIEKYSSSAIIGGECQNFAVFRCRNPRKRQRCEAVKVNLEEVNMPEIERELKDRFFKLTVKAKAREISARTDIAESLIRQCMLLSSHSMVSEEKIGRITIAITQMERETLEEKARAAVSGANGGEGDLATKKASVWDIGKAVQNLFDMVKQACESLTAEQRANVIEAAAIEAGIKMTVSREE